MNSLGVAWQRRQAVTSAAVARETSERDYQEYATAFRMLVATVTQAGVRLVVVAFPQVKQLVADACSDAPQRFVERLSRETGTPFLDLAPECRRHSIEDLYLLAYDPRRPLQATSCFAEERRFVGNTHPSRYGYGVAARAIAAWLSSLGLP